MPTTTDALTTFEHEGLTFEVDDSGGGGDAVVLLHGFPQTNACWRAVTPTLVDTGHRVLAPLQRGYSRGARPPRRRDYTVDHLVGDVLALADTAGVERFHVVGHDWGGAIAWSLASDHPDRLASVTSVATPHPAAMQKAMLTSDQGLKSAYMAFFQLPWVPEAMFHSDRGGQRVRKAFESSGMPPVDAEGCLERLRAGALTPALHWYRAIPFGARSAPGPSTVPTLYVYPSGDAALGRKAADLTADHVTGPYRYEVLEGANHWVPEQEADRLGALLVEHLGAHPA